MPPPRRSYAFAVAVALGSVVVSRLGLREEIGLHVRKGLERDRRCAHTLELCSFVCPTHLCHPQRQRLVCHARAIVAEGTVRDALKSLGSSYVDVSPPPEVLERLQLLHADPPVFLLPDFWPADLCEDLIEAAIRSGAMVESTCTDDGDRVSGMRTSSSLVLKPHLLQRLGAGEIAARRLHRDLGSVLGIGAASPTEQLTGEYPQVVRYQAGQRFATHEDAFPMSQARRSDYQRRATLIVYLNDVAKGGATSFEQLDIRVQPAKGTALLFFPAFADGKPDERTRHAAEPAVDEKWIAQVWVGGSMPKRRPRARE